MASTQWCFKRVKIKSDKERPSCMLNYHEIHKTSNDLKIPSWIQWRDPAEESQIIVWSHSISFGTHAKGASGFMNENNLIEWGLMHENILPPTEIDYKLTFIRQQKDMSTNRRTNLVFSYEELLACSNLLTSGKSCILWQMAHNGTAQSPGKQMKTKVFCFLNNAGESFKGKDPLWK